jgi:ferredoxin-fold anticodon binding domain-containing protein
MNLAPQIYMILNYLLNREKRQRIRQIQNKMNNLHPVSEEEFREWKEVNKYHPLIKNYVDYMNMVNISPKDKRMGDTLMEAIYEVFEKDPNTPKNHFFSRPKKK